MITWTERLARAKKPDTLIDKMTTRIEELAPQIKKLRELEKEMEDIKNALEIHANEEYLDTSEVSFISDHVQVDFGARSIVRKIKDVKGLMKAVGREQFFACVTFPLTKLDELLTREQQKPYVTSRRVGPRACRIKLISEK